MRRRSARTAVRRRFVDEDVDSRWWYWVAAIPAAAAFWTITVAWVAVAVSVGPIDGANPIVRSARLSLVAFGVPFLALTAVFPFAVYADSSAALSAEGGWRPRRLPFTGAAAIGPLVVIGIGIADLASDGALEGPDQAIVLGFLLTVPTATYYLYRRHARIGVP